MPAQKWCSTSVCSFWFTAVSIPACYRFFFLKERKTLWLHLPSQLPPISLLAFTAKLRRKSPCSWSLISLLPYSCEPTLWTWSVTAELLSTWSPVTLTFQVYWTILSSRLIWPITCSIRHVWSPSPSWNTHFTCFPNTMPFISLLTPGLYIARAPSPAPHLPNLLDCSWPFLFSILLVTSSISILRTLRLLSPNPISPLILKSNCPLSIPA